MFAEMSSYHYPATTRGLHGQWPKPHTSKEVCCQTLRAFGLNTLYNGDNQAVLGVTRRAEVLGADTPDYPVMSARERRRTFEERVPEMTLRRTMPGTEHGDGHAPLRGREAKRWKSILRSSSLHSNVPRIDVEASNAAHFYRRPGITYFMDPPNPWQPYTSSYDRQTLCGLPKDDDPMRRNTRALIGRKIQYGSGHLRMGGGSTTPARGSGPTEPEDWMGGPLGESSVPIAGRAPLNKPYGYLG